VCVCLTALAALGAGPWACTADSADPRGRGVGAPRDVVIDWGALGGNRRYWYFYRVNGQAVGNLPSLKRRLAVLPRGSRIWVDPCDRVHFTKRGLLEFCNRHDLVFAELSAGGSERGLGPARAD